MTDTASPTAPPLPPDGNGTPGWTIGRVLALILGLGMLVFWIWAFSPLAPTGHPDRLDDDGFATAADPRCTDANALVSERVPLATEAVDYADRAGQIIEATAIYQEMVDDLTAIAPAAGSHDGDLIRLWLADWQTYLGDRLRHADKLLAGIDEPFVVTARSGTDQITDPIDNFAKVNLMPNCVSPLDV